MVARDLSTTCYALAPQDGTSGWQVLKREPKRPTTREVRFCLQHIRQIEALAGKLPAISTIPVPKLRYFRTLARAIDVNELNDLTPMH